MPEPRKPNAICACGHTGSRSRPDGEHASGACSRCECQKFAWADWLPEVKQWLSSPLPARGERRRDRR